MTAPDREWTPLEDDDALLEVEALAEEGTEPEALADPAPEVEAAPEPAPAAPVPAAIDFAGINELVAAERARLSQATQPAAPAAPPEWVSPYDRPGVNEELNALLERSFDPAALPEYNRRVREMEAEIRQHDISQAIGQLQQNIRLESSAPTMTRQAFEAVRGSYTDQLTEQDFTSVASEIFPDPANMARALDSRFNPQADQTRQMIADAALGRAMRSGRLQTAPAPTPPPAVRSSARQTVAAAPTRNELLDPDYMNNLIANLSGKRKA